MLLICSLCRKWTREVYGMLFPVCRECRDALEARLAEAQANEETAPEQDVVIA